MNENNQQRQATSTQVRNIYSEGMSYINIKFFNMYMSLQFFKFLSKDDTGRSTYQQPGLTTTVNWDSAYSLFQVSHEILNGDPNKGYNLVVPCKDGSLTLERKMSQNNQMETTLTIMKNNESIPFKFTTTTFQEILNGQSTSKTVESGLGTFAMTLHGYLTGINADRHLDKMTEDYVKSLGPNANPPQQNQYNNRGGGFQTGSGYQGNRNNNRGGGNRGNWNRRPYNNQYNNPNPQQNQQNMSSYQLPQ